MTSFDLANQPWIPVRFHGESQAHDVSIREALARAPDIAELTDPSPLVTIALHRLLLAICHRVWGPDSEAAWQQLWQAKRFDVAALDEYLGSWRHRFDLFDGARPFYQTPGLPESVSTTVAKLGHEFAAGNNAALFDHSLDADPEALLAADAARLLVAVQAFSIGGLVTRLPGDPPSAESAHLVKSAVHLVIGASLFETLLLNLTAIESGTGPLNLIPEENRPAWELDPPVAAARTPAGLLDLLTWQSRRVLLFPNADGSVSRVTIMAGLSFPGGTAVEVMEPMAAFVKRDVKNQYPWAPLGFRPEEALWRQSAALFRFAADGKPAATLAWLRTLRQNRYLDDSQRQLALFGLSSDRAKIFLWREERLPLHVAYVEDFDLVARLSSAVEVARATGRALRTASWAMASEALAPDDSADRDRVSALADSLAVERSYWPALDAPFRKLMVELAESYPSDGGIAAEETWAMNIRTAATNAFELAAGALENGSRGYRAAAIQRPRFRAALAAALRPLMPPVQEVTT